MRKFLNYDEGNRANLSGSDLIVCITFDVVELAQSGFMQIFRIAQCLGKLVFILTFQIAFAVIDGSEFLLIFTSILPTLIIPFIFVIFIRAREGVSVRLRTSTAVARLGGSALAVVAERRISTPPLGACCCAADVSASATSRALTAACAT